MQLSLNYDRLAKRTLQASAAQDQCQKRLLINMIKVSSFLLLKREDNTIECQTLFTQVFMDAEAVVCDSFLCAREKRHESIMASCTKVYVCPANFGHILGSFYAYLSVLKIMHRKLIQVWIITNFKVVSLKFAFKPNDSGLFKVKRISLFKLIIG